MKRILNLLVLMAFALNVCAIDELQIRPCQTIAGMSDEDDDAYIELVLVNESFDVANLQFDLLLPEGMEYADYAEFTDRVPSTTKKGKTTYDFSFQTNVISSGYTRFMFIPGGDLRPIEKGEGTIMYINFSTDASMAPGVYPIRMTNIKLVESETSAITINDVVSYVVIGETSAMTTGADLDLSMLTGDMPSFVVEGLNEDMAANSNLRSVNLSGVTSFGAELVIPENVVWQTAEKGGLKRTFPAGQRSTVCLPFALSAEQLAVITERGGTVETLTGFNAETNTVKFDPVTEMAANTPYLVSSETEQALFNDIEGVGCSLSGTVVAVTQGDLSMEGSFEKKTISSDADVTYFAFNAADGNFVRIGSNATVNPFRAYLKLAGASSARYLAIGETGTTGVDQRLLTNDSWTTDAVYTLQGVRANGNQRGLYIKNGKKIIVK